MYGKEISIIINRDLDGCHIVWSVWNVFVCSSHMVTRRVLLNYKLFQFTLSVRQFRFTVSSIFYDFSSCRNRIKVQRIQIVYRAKRITRNRSKINENKNIRRKKKLHKSHFEPYMAVSWVHDMSMNTEHWTHTLLIYAWMWICWMCCHNGFG